jgi:hypothetical protein
MHGNRALTIQAPTTGKSDKKSQVDSMIGCTLDETQVRGPKQPGHRYAPVTRQMTLPTSSATSSER